MIAGNAGYTGGTTIFGGVMMLGNGGAGGGSILGNVAFCNDATNPQCDTSTNKVLAFNRSAECAKVLLAVLPREE
jgi:hypothetical protein